MEPVGAPLPRIAGDGAQAVAVGWERVHRAGRGVAVVSAVVVRELSLPDVAQVPSTGSQLVAPRVDLLLQAAARGVFPLRFGRQALACPARVGGGVVPGDV